MKQRFPYMAGANGANFGWKYHKTIAHGNLQQPETFLNFLSQLFGNKQ